jgi:hypothetical protein
MLQKFVIMGCAMFFRFPRAHSEAGFSNYRRLYIRARQIRSETTVQQFDAEVKIDNGLEKADTSGCGRSDSSGVPSKKQIEPKVQAQRSHRQPGHSQCLQAPAAAPGQPSQRVEAFGNAAGAAQPVKSAPR